MKTSEKEIDDLINRKNLNSRLEIVETLPNLMCHVGQEENPAYRARKTHYIRMLTLMTPEDYISYFVGKRSINEELITSDGRAMCLCKHMAEVAAKLTSRLEETDVFIIGRCLPSYVRGRNPLVRHHHYLPVLIGKDGELVYFDPSVYKKIYLLRENEWVNPNTTDFDKSNIDYERFISHKRFLQNGQDQVDFKDRRIEIVHREQKSVLLDSYSLLETNKGEYYSRVECPDTISRRYSLNKGVLTMDIF